MIFKSYKFYAGIVDIDRQRRKNMLQRKINAILNLISTFLLNCADPGSGKYECSGLISRLLGRQFHSALIENGKCYGALLYNEYTRKIETV